MDKTSKVFGIGLGKTGTTSLTAALKILGYKSIHYPIKMTDFDKFDAITDIPGAMGREMYKTLDTKYPNAKFILTVRERKSWLKSIRTQIVSKIGTNKDSLLMQKRLKCWGTLEFDDKLYSDIYDDYYMVVTKYFKNRKKDLLIYDVCAKEGWNKLCKFLDKKVPNEEFPFENKTPFLVL